MTCATLLHVHSMPATVLLSLIIFREIPGVLFWVALLVMALGVYLNVTEES